LIGSKTVAILRQGGNEVVAASPNTGVNTITGEGLKEAVAGAQVVIDLANSPSFEDKAVLEFFETSGRNLLAAEAASGVRHHVALSIVGTDRAPDNGYFRAKVAQENLIEASGIPYTVIRSTQFMEFLSGIADSSTDGNIVRLSPGLFQPIAADDVAPVVAEVALAAPRNGIVEIAGPERAPFNEIVARYLKAVGDPREVVSDPEAQYWGGRVEQLSPRPHRSRRMAPPLTGSSLIPHLRYAQSVRAGPGQRTKEATMTIKLVALVLLCLMTGTAVAQEPKVTSLMSKDLPENPGREALMITVEHAPGGSSAIHRHNAHAFVYVLEGSVVMQLKGGQQVTLTPGQSFYEGPDDVHVVDRNASGTQPAKFLVLLIKDKGAPALVPAQ
ncbi:MAG TPA: cupin domain-containing protein, partial [Stellaceae bacterium]|nr:cupin domain-containing protein [Stellaceae bacterium]